MLPSVITIVSPTEAYMQKVKPSPIGQADIETLCARLNVAPQGVVGSILDDVLEDEGGALHPARRLTVRLATIPVEPGAVLLKARPARKARAPDGDAGKRKRGRPPKAEGTSA